LETLRDEVGGNVRVVDAGDRWLKTFDTMFSRDYLRATLI